MGLIYGIMCLFIALLEGIAMGKRGRQGTVEITSFGQGREEKGDNIDNIVEGVVIFYNLPLYA